MEQTSIFPGQEILPPIERRNPNNGHGRPKGARNHCRAMQRIAEGHSIALIETLIAQALAGDPLSMRIVMDRIWPRPRSAPIEMSLPRTESAADLRQAMHTVLAEVAAGKQNPDTGQAMMAMLKDMLIAHSVQTVGTGTGPASDTIDVRERLASRLTRALELRQAAIASPAVTDLPAADRDADDGPTD